MTIDVSNRASRRNTPAISWRQELRRLSPRYLVSLYAKYGIFVMAITFVLLFSALMILKHNAFNTRVYDFARFSQAIWNTTNGRFLYSTINSRSILGNHFSPIMALVAPLLRIWPDERLLFVIQTVNVAAAGLCLYYMVREQHPRLAFWFPILFFLNPIVHEVTLFEFRRITFAMPFLALSLYALSRGKRPLLLLGLLLALLAKENVGFFVFMIGVYLLLFERDWKWGLGLMALGASWVVVVSVWVIPAFAASSSGNEVDVYPQLYYFDFLGSTYEEIWRTLVADPLIFFRQMLQPPQLWGIFRILLPLGLLLPLLAPRWVMLCLPYLSVLLLSADEDMFRLEKWYPATLLVVLFAAIIVGWERVPKKWERWAIAWLLLCTAVGYALYSHAPLGGRYDASLYEASDRDQLGLAFLQTVPAEARVASQVKYVPHLTHREYLYVYPWIRIGPENIDYFILDRRSNPWPQERNEINEQITNMVADPSNVVVQEADGLYLIHNGGPQLASFPVDKVAEGSIYLDRVEVAGAGDGGFFRTAANTAVTAQRGQTLRVTLYWEALAPPGAERTVSVRLAASSGTLIAQHDSLPAGGSKPTSWWETGWKIRDVYYLEIPADAPLESVSLDVVLYDTYDLEIVPLGEKEITNLLSIEIVDNLLNR